jgi:hypothetical protein
MCADAEGEESAMSGKEDNDVPMLRVQGVQLDECDRGCRT